MTEHNNVQERMEKDGEESSTRDLGRLEIIRTCVTIARSCGVTRSNRRLDNLCRGLCDGWCFPFFSCFFYVLILNCGCRSEGLNNSCAGPSGQASLSARAKQLNDG